MEVNGGKGLVSMVVQSHVEGGFIGIWWWLLIIKRVLTIAIALICGAQNCDL